MSSTPSSASSHPYLSNKSNPVLRFAMEKGQLQFNFSNGVATLVESARPAAPPAPGKVKAVRRRRQAVFGSMTMSSTDGKSCDRWHAGIRSG